MHKPFQYNPDIWSNTFRENFQNHVSGGSGGGG